MTAVLKTVGEIELMVSIRRRLGDRFAYLGGLPTAEVYALLFGRYPELERLFSMDRDGGVRTNRLVREPR